jgi:TonB family protein
MAFFSDSQETISRFGSYIDELQDLFRTSGVPFGEPGNFFAFARKLQKDIQLRDNLSPLTKSIMERESEVSLRTLLTILAIASGGPDIATTEREIGTPVNLVLDFLISGGGCSPISAEHPDSPCSESAIDTAEDSVEFDRSYGHPPHEAHSNPFASTTITGEEDGEELIPHSTFDSPPDPIRAGSHDVHMLTESLSRLELNSLQIKFYLDSIDQRITRMEPRLENIPPLALPAAPQPSSERVGSRVSDRNTAKFSAAVPPPPQHSDSHPDQDPGSANQQGAANREAVANRQELVTKEAEANQATEPKNEPEPEQYPQATRNLVVLTQPWIESWITFRHQPPSGNQYLLQIFLLCAALLLADLVYWRLGHDTTLAKSAPVSKALPPSAGSPPAQPQKPSATIPPTQPGTNSQHAAQSNLSLNPQIPIAMKQSATSSPTHFNPSTPLLSASEQSSAEVATETNSGAVGFSRVSAPRTSTRWSPTALSNRPVNVSSGVMAANLLSAPKPSYPKLASLTHTRGNVVMQALISRKGTVENLRVIKGHHLLRGAATSAVRTWRFRPYTVDGVPVEVATTVSVDVARH